MKTRMKLLALIGFFSVMIFPSDLFVQKSGDVLLAVDLPFDPLDPCKKIKAACRAEIDARDAQIKQLNLEYQKIIIEHEKEVQELRQEILKLKQTLAQIHKGQYVSDEQSTQSSNKQTSDSKATVPFKQRPIPK